MMGPDESHQKVFACLTKLFLGCFSICALLCALLFALAILLLILISVGYKGNYAAVDYRNGKVVIYQAKYRDMTGLPDKKVWGIRISRDYSHGLFRDEVWQIRRKSVKAFLGRRRALCSKQELRKALSRVVYGEVPSCYAEEIPARSLKNHQIYYVAYSHEPATGEAVWFRIRECDKDKTKTCLYTNSPRESPKKAGK